MTESSHDKWKATLKAMNEHCRAMGSFHRKLSYLSDEPSEDAWKTYNEHAQALGSLKKDMPNSSDDKTERASTCMAEACEANDWYVSHVIETGCDSIVDLTSAKKEFTASKAEGYRLLTALDSYMTKVIEVDRELAPLWLAPLEAGESRNSLMRGFDSDSRAHELTLECSRLENQVESAKHWFIQLGFEDDGEEITSAINIIVQDMGSLLFDLTFLGIYGPPLPPELVTRLENIQKNHSLWIKRFGLRRSSLKRIR